MRRLKEITKDLRRAWKEGHFKHFTELINEIDSLDWRPLEEIPENQLVDVRIVYPAFDGELEKIETGMFVHGEGWELADTSIKEFTVTGWRYMES